MPVVVLLAEVDLGGDLDERAHRRLGERARSRMRRAVERHGGACVELPPRAVLAAWTSGDAGDPVRAVRAAEELRGSLAPLGEAVAVHAALEAARSDKLLSGAALAGVTALCAQAGRAEVLVGPAARERIGAEAVFDEDEPARLVDGARAAPRPEPVVSEEGTPALSWADGELPPTDLPEAADERLATLFNARAWEALRALFAPDWRQVDHRPSQSEGGRTRDELVAGLRATAAEAPDAEATIQRRSLDGSLALGVLRISGHRGGRPFETAHALLTLSGSDGIELSELFALGDRAAARARFDELRGAPPEEEAGPRGEGAEPRGEGAEEPSPAPSLEDDPEAARVRHEAQLLRWCAWFDGHDVDALVDQGLAEDFVQIDHRGTAGPAERDREAFRVATASSLEMIPDLRAEAELLEVDGDARVARIVYTGSGVRMTTHVLARLEGDRIARQEIFEDAAAALDALSGAVPAG